MKNQSKFKVVLDTSGSKYEAKGDSIDEAISNLNLSWEQIKAKGDMTVTHRGKSYTHLFYLRPLRRIFANKTMRLIQAKRLALLLSEQK